MDPAIIYNTLVKARENLKVFQYDHLLRVIDSIPMSHMLGVRILKGSMIFRSRPTEDYDFSTVEELSYNKKTTSFGRAHRPGFPIFYGAIATRPDEDYLEQLAQVYSESLELIRNKITTKGEKKLTIGRWISDEDLFIIVMVFHEPFIDMNSHLRELYNKYLPYIAQFTKNDLNLKILKLISNEFVKTNILTDDDYKISSAFVESILKRSLIEVDGIIYPSVRCDGENFNIALTPKCIDLRLSLTDVITTTLYFKNDVVVSDYEKQARLLPGEKNFILKKITDPKIHLGKERTLKALEEQIIVKNQLKI
ncbi:MAG: hypothetical protein NTU98_11190 [Bacteroidetes bacterium]|nr:hypothetical protein [Bacteroidota bacterium]